jgi:sugar lactone lactonase YvrE
MSRQGAILQAELVARATTELGESPFWDDHVGAPSWIDMISGELLQGEAAEVVRRAGQRLAAAVPRQGAGWAAASFHGLGHLADDGLNVCVEVCEGGQRLNDAKCDAAGRMWVGRTTTGVPTRGAGALLCWTRHDQVREVWTGLTQPNGMGWSPDGRTFYLVDTADRVLLRAAFDPESGGLGDPSQLVSFPGEAPDGLCVAADGSLWVALWGIGEVRRLTPDGTRIGTVSVPVSRPSSCALGPDGTLYITTARWGLSPEDLRSEHLAGSLFGAATHTPPVPVGALRW